MLISLSYFSFNSYNKSIYFFWSITGDNLDNGVWNGQVYDAYKNYGKQYKESMMNYASNLSKYSSILKSAAEEGQILIDEVKKSVEVDL